MKYYDTNELKTKPFLPLLDEVVAKLAPASCNVNMGHNEEKDLFAYHMQKAMHHLINARTVARLYEKSVDNKDG